MSRRVDRCLSIHAVWLVVLLFAGDANAQTWEHVYDASLGTKPSAQGFDHFSEDPLPDDGLDESNYTVAGGVLTQGPTGGGSNDDANRQWYELTSETLDFDADVIVVEFSLRILDSTINPPPAAGPRAGFGVSVTDRKSNLVVAYIGSTGAFLYGSDSATSPLVAFDATDIVHDYVLRIGSGGASLELDGSEIATLDREVFGTSAAVPNRLSIGDVTILQRSSSELTTFGIARFPVPSPEVRNYEVVSQTTASDSTSPKSLTVACPAGSVALTGGASTSAGPDIGVSASHPGAGDPPTSWTGAAREIVATGASWDLRVDVVCGEVSGYERFEMAGPQSTNASQTAFLECPDGKRPFSGGVALSGASLQQTLTQSVSDESLILVPRWLAGAQDFGAVTSSGSWGIDVHTICSDASRQEFLVDETAIIPGSPRSKVLNCLGGKLPIGGGAFGGDGGLEWSRPKDGAPSEPPVGWDAQARGAGSWKLGVRLECAPLADPTVSARGLMSRFRAEFDAYDSWGWAHATLTNGVMFGAGIDGAAFEFDGTGDRWVSVPSQTFNEYDGIDWYPQGDFTIGAWIQSNRLVPGGEPQMIVHLYDPGGFAQANWSTYFLQLTTDLHLLAYLRGPGSNTGTTIVEHTTPVDDGGWHHVAFSRSLADGNLNLYLDGVLVDQEALNAFTVQPLTPGNPGFGDPVAIGAQRLTQSTDIIREFDGHIDDVSYWENALTLEEIQNVAGCHRQLEPRVLNLAADRFASPTGAGHELCVYLEAGPHDLTLIDPAVSPDARFTGWSPGPGMPWGTVFSVDPDIDAGFTFGLPVGAASGQAAFDATLDKDTTLTLSQAQRVRFSLVDSTAFDNLGGVSIQLPEPGVGLGLASGAGLLALLARRRGRRGRRRD